jgi:hypothetical protein
LENKLYDAASFIEAGETYDEQCAREDSLVGHLPEAARKGLADWVNLVVEWKEAQ